jgi:hypothetical protein
MPVSMVQQGENSMRKFLVKILLAAILVSSAGFSQTYTTNFPLTESRISDGGKWINVDAINGNGAYISTTPGLAVGHSGPARYADATAYLTGNWAPDQMAQATVYAGAVVNAPEVGLHLRTGSSNGQNQGYEISHSVAGGQNGTYLIVVQYGHGTFAILKWLDGAQYSIKTGDTVKATIVGNVITAYKNGVQETQVTDNTWSFGTPGMGFNELTNGDYGITSFTATGLSTLISVPRIAEFPSRSRLCRNALSLLNPDKTLEHTFSSLGFINLTMYDMLGRETIALMSEANSAESFRAHLNGSAAGMSAAKLSLGGSNESLKTLQLR